MEEKLKKIREKSENKTEKLYYSITAKDDETFEEVDKILNKYIKKINDLGMTCRVKDRR